MYSTSNESIRALSQSSPAKDESAHSRRREGEDIGRFQVCSNCKRLKRKCNLERPSCSRCRASGYVCQYDSKKRRPGPAKGSVGSKTKALTSRINHLENLLQGLQNQLMSTLISQSQPAQSNPTNSQIQAEAFQVSQEAGLLQNQNAPGFLYNESHILPQDIQQGGQDTNLLLQFPIPFDQNFYNVTSSSSFHNHIQQPLPFQNLGPDLSFSAEKLPKNDQQILIDLYFNHIQHIFPMFRRPVLEKDLSNNYIPTSLLNAMFAVASRFLSPDDTTRMFGQADAPWEKFAQLAHEETRYRLEGDGVISLNDIKTACLLAVHEYTTYPGRKAWMYVSRVARLALVARLHQIDCPANPVGLPEEDKEEWRFVWWAIWKLDSTINVVAVSPFGTDCMTIGTALVSTTVEDFTQGSVKPSTKTFLETDPAKAWKAVGELQLTDPGDGINIHLLATLLLRSVSQCQQRLYANSRTEILGQRMALKNAFTCIRLALPDWYFVAIRRPMEQPHAHRRRLEVIIMLYTSQLIINEPTQSPGAGHFPRVIGDAINIWQDSLKCAQELADLFHHWKSDYFAVADPMISCAIWHAHCGLTLYKMSCLHEGGPTLDISSNNALDLLSIALENFARWWQIARILQRSLKVFQMWNWVQLDASKLTQVVAQIRRAINPYAHEPGSVDISLICASFMNDISEMGESNMSEMADMHLMV